MVTSFPNENHSGRARGTTVDYTTCARPRWSPMSFSTDIAKLISNQLTRLVTFNRHQLAGQVANLDFWIAEIGHGFEVIDGYGRRFQNLKSAQARHAAEHQTREFALH